MNTLLNSALVAALLLGGAALAQTPQAPSPSKAPAVNAPAVKAPPKGPARPAKPTVEAPPLEPQAPAAAAAMRIKSASIVDGEIMPPQIGCKGRNVSPDLHIIDVPKGTVSVVLVLNDPDAPRGSFIHWLVYDLPVSNLKLDEAQPKGPNPFIAGGKQGLNDFKGVGYDGPCPPEGFHRYELTAYALDRMLGLPAGVTWPEVQKLIRGRVLAQATLSGRYSKD